MTPDPTALAASAAPAFSELTTQRDTATVLGPVSAAAGADATCAQEPIRVSGSIQPHGALLVIDPLRDWTAVAASRNAVELLASPSMGRVIGLSIACLLGQAFA